MINTKLYKINNDESDIMVMKEAGDIIKQGGLVAFPTETVYGLGGDALNKDASGKIYRAKGRPSDNPLIVHIASMQDLSCIVSRIPESAYQLAESFWPGPLTMIFEKSDIVPYETTGGLGTVAVRMPNHQGALEFIRAAGGYIAAPSANTSGRPSPTTAKHVMDDMSGKIEMILDGGAVGIGVESTIVDLTGKCPTILRPGYINQEMLEKVLGRVEVDKAILGELADGTKPKAPGMKYKHYAPKGELYLVEGELDCVIKCINDLTNKNQELGKKVGVIATDETSARYQCKIVKSIGSRSEEETIARHLYSILREFDDMGVSIIYSEVFNTPKLGQAVMNRLLKAAGHKIIHAE